MGAALLDFPSHRIADEDEPEYDTDHRHEPRSVGFGIVDPQVRALKNGYATAVYECLAAHVNPNGECWPSLATICEHVGWSKPTVIKAIKALTDAGLVTVETQRSKGLVLGNRYTLPLRNPSKSTSFTQSNPIMTEAVNDVESGGKGDLLRQSTSLTQVVKDVDSGGKRRLHKQDSVKQDSREQDIAAGAEPAPRPQTTSMPYLLFAAMCDEQGVDPSTVDTQNQKKQMAVTKRLAAAGMVEQDMRHLIRWASGWATGIDAFLVEKQLTRWKLAGSPAEPERKPAVKPVAHNSPRAKGPVF